MYPFCDGLPEVQAARLSTDEPACSVLTRQGPSSLPMVRHHWSASTSFVLAALRALHIDPSGAVTKSAMIEEGTSSPWTWHVARTHRKRPSGRGNYERGSLNRPTFMPGGPDLFSDARQTACQHEEAVGG